MVGVSPTFRSWRIGGRRCAHHVLGVWLARIDALGNWLESTGTTRACRSAHSVPDELYYQRIPLPVERAGGQTAALLRRQKRDVAR